MSGSTCYDVVSAVPEEMVVQSSSRELVPARTSWTRVGAGGISVSRYHRSLQHTYSNRDYTTYTHVLVI